MAEHQRHHVLDEAAAAGAERHVSEQRADDARQVHEHGEGVQVVEQQLRELRALAQVQPAEVPPDHQPDGVDGPCAALLVHVGHVLGGVLSHGAHDRQVHALPAAAQRLHAGLQVLDQVPRREQADVLERRAAPNDPRAAGKGRVGGVAREHLAAVEHRLAVVERVAGADLRFLDRLHVGEALVVLELPDHLAQEAVRAELVVAVARLDVAQLRDARRSASRNAELRLPALAAPSRPGREARRWRVVEDRPALHRERERRVVAVVADHDHHPLARPVLRAGPRRSCAGSSPTGSPQQGMMIPDRRLLAVRQRMRRRHRAPPVVERRSEAWSRSVNTLATRNGHASQGRWRLSEANSHGM